MARFYVLPTGVWGAGEPEKFNDAQTLSTNAAMLNQKNQQEARNQGLEVTKMIMSMPVPDAKDTEGMQNYRMKLQQLGEERGRFVDPYMRTDQYGNKTYSTDIMQKETDHHPMYQRKLDMSNALTNFYNSEAPGSIMNTAGQHGLPVDKFALPAEAIALNMNYYKQEIAKATDPAVKQDWINKLNAASKQYMGLPQNEVDRFLEKYNPKTPNNNNFYQNGVWYQVPQLIPDNPIR